MVIIDKFKNLMKKFKNKELIPIKLTYISQDNSQDINKLYICGYYGKNNILAKCPVSEFFKSDNFILKLDFNKIRNALIRRLGITYDFIIDSIHDLENIIYISKVKADHLKEINFFFGQDPIEEDEIVEGTITAIQKNSIFLEIEGVSTQIHKSELTNSKIETIKDYFSVGDKIKVLVKEIELNEDEESVKNLIVSRKDLSILNSQELLSSYTPGEVVYGKVSYISPTELNILLKNGLGITIFASRDTDDIKLNQFVSVVIDFIDFEKAKIFGTIINAKKTFIRKIL